jgi:hypothetical protein
MENKQRIDDYVNSYFIFSTSGSSGNIKPQLNPALWAYYGDSNQGVCLGLTMKSFTCKYPYPNTGMSYDQDWIKYGLGYAEYFLDWLLSNLDNEEVNPAFVYKLFAKYAKVKFESWERENEFRYAIYEPQHHREPGVKFQIEPEDIVEIIFGLKTPEEKILALQTEVLSKGWTHIRYWQTQMTNEAEEFALKQL